METILKEISLNWKLEAKQEDGLRYFYHVDEAKAIVNGDMLTKCLTQCEII